LKNTSIWWVNIISGIQILNPHANDNNNLQAKTIEENTIIYEIHEWVNLSWNKNEKYGYYIVTRWEWNVKIPIKITKSENTYSLELLNTTTLTDEQGLIDSLRSMYKRVISSKPPLMLEKTLEEIREKFTGTF